MRTLVIDGSRTWRVVHVAMLRSLGHEGIAEASGREDALSKAAALRPGLILLSRTVAGDDPGALIDALRRSNPRAVVLMVAGASDSRRSAQGLASGADGCLFTPYTQDDLRARIREATEAAA